MAKIISLLLLASASVARAQSPITSISLGPDQIGMVKTAQGITTRVSFPDKVSEIICGDLYDPASGKGTFVVQSSGNDVFLKPIASKGMSNLFVKVGEGGKQTYNFDLLIVAVAQAHRVVNVAGPTAPAQPPQADPTARDVRPAVQNGVKPQEAKPQEDDQAEARRQAALEQARREADEILRKARQQAGRIIEEADQRLADVERQAAQRASQETDHRFIQSLILGLREVRINNPRASAKKINVTLDPRILVFNEKSYLRYVIQNGSESEFVYNSISLEAGPPDNSQPLSIEVSQTKNDNKLAPGESLTGIIAFDGKAVGAKDKITFYIRGEDKAEIARVNVQ